MTPLQNMKKQVLISFFVRLMQLESFTSVYVCTPVLFFDALFLMSFIRD